MAGSVRHWTPKHVGRWLREEGFCDYVDLLCNKHRLDGSSLLTLSEYDLRSPPLELKVLGDIKRLMVSLRKLQKQNTDVLEELGLCYDGHSPQNSAGALSVPAFVQFVASVDRFTLQTAEAQHNHFNVKLQKDTHIT